MRIESWQRNLAALWVAETLAFVAFSFVFPFMPLYIQTMGGRGPTEAAQWAGAISAVAAVPLTVSQPIWGNLADRWGRKPMVIRSMLGAGIPLTLMGLATSPEQLLVLAFLLGALTGTQAASNALVATIMPRERLGFALGLVQVAIFLGFSVGPLVGGLVADALGYGAAFHVSGALMVMAAAIVLGLVHEGFTPAAAGAPRKGIWAESRSLLAIALFPLLAGVVFLVQFGNVAVIPILSLFVEELTAGENAATAVGTVLAATGVASAASAVAAGRLGDRVGHKAILRICLAGAALSCFPQAFVQDFHQLLLLRMVLGVFLGGLMPSANALLAGIVPQERQGAAFGLTAVANNMANVAGPLIGAAVATYWGVRAVFLVTGAIFALATAQAAMGLRKGELPREGPDPKGLRDLSGLDARPEVATPGPTAVDTTTEGRARRP